VSPGQSTGDVDEEESRARAVARALALGQHVSSSDLQLVRTKLRVHVRRSLPDAGIAELDDIVDTSIENFLMAVRSDRVEPATALAYVRKIATNAGIDHMRRRRRETALPEYLSEEPTNDDAIARLISAHADAKTVEAILAKAARERDHTTTKVINAYLNLAQTTGRDPSHRLVAFHSGVSHTTVRHVLARLKAQLDGDHFPE
jgi:DNA-directed RNA polymerase specialized sigma24 family protein